MNTNNFHQQMGHVDLIKAVFAAYHAKESTHDLQGIAHEQGEDDKRRELFQVSGSLADLLVIHQTLCKL
jgi:hypothetical protein